MRFSIPSFSKILEVGLKTYYRFPFVIISAIIGTGATILSIELSDSFLKDNSWIIKTIFIGWLGISLFTAIDTFAESRSWNTLHKYLGRLIGVFLLLIYFMLAGDRFIEGPAEFYYRFTLFVLASHLLVAVAPFLSKGNIDQFWEYNKSLFLRICISALYSGVLFVGLSVAMLSIDNLLGVDIKGERYGQLFMFLIGIFNTWFFLAVIPELETTSEVTPQYSKALKVFVQFVLIPLVTVYIGILYLYTGKILIQWELPNGWVSYLVLSFSIIGIFSLLLLYPIRNNKENTWINIYSKGYYLALIPLIGLLLFSIYVRIDEYGVTINRYFVATLGVWLTGIVMYFIFSKVKSIKVIPISMCLVALGISFGPMSAFSVSERSQLGRFEEVLERNDMLDENNLVVIKTETDTVSFKDRKELSSIVEFLITNHGAKALDKYFTVDIVSTLQVNEESNRYDGGNAKTIMTSMGLKYVSYWENEDDGMDLLDGNYFRYNLANNHLLNIEGYDLRFGELFYLPEDDFINLTTDRYDWSTSYSFVRDTLTIREENDDLRIDISFIETIERIREEYPGNGSNVNEKDISKMIIETENEELKVRVLLTSIRGSLRKESELDAINIELYIKIKQ